MASQAATLTVFYRPRPHYPPRAPWFLHRHKRVALTRNGDVGYNRDLP